MIRSFLALVLCLAGTTLARAETLTVYAAASLGNALTDIVRAYEQTRPGLALRTSFASSATLARQIEAGAPADLFVSADRQWMDYLAERGLIDAASRRDLLGNTLVLVAPAAAPLHLALSAGRVPVFSGRLCMGDPASVPAGRYGRQALMHLGWWAALAPRVVPAEDVRAALAFVERGECALGIVYGTDARQSRRVVIAGRFPPHTHEPIVYPVALRPGAPAAAREFLRYLQGPQARRLFTAHGFTVLSP